MFYLALTLIVLGLGMILYYIFADAAETGTVQASGSQPGAAHNVDLPGPNRAHLRPAPTGSPQTQAASAGAPAPSWSSLPARPTRPIPVPQSFGQDSSDGGSGRRPAGRSVISPPSPAFVLSGVLFLKASGTLSEIADLLGEGEQMLSGVRRVGTANLIVEGGRFLIRAGDASFSYSANDLAEVRFEQGGFSLIPVDPSRPVPVFLTEHPDQLKGYLKEHSASGVR